MKKLLGFTLAEVLITLSIIGVISAITLPSLQINVERQSLGPQISKFYSQFQEGLKRYMAAEGIETLPNNAAWVRTFARDYLSVEYVCTGNADDNCFADSYRNINNGGNATTRGNIIGDGSGFGGILKDGAVFYIKGNSVLFDSNGKRGPNTLGLDLHGIRIGNNGVLNAPPRDMFTDNAVLMRHNNDLTTSFNNCRAGTDYFGCLNHLLRNNFKFDY